MKSGIVEVFKLGQDYQFKRNEQKNVYEFIYRGYKGDIKRDVYRYVVNARGQSRFIKTDPSALFKNLLKRGIFRTEETQLRPHIDQDGSASANPLCRASQTYKTGSVWIDPKTHQIMRLASDQTITNSDAIYAVGAMTRGQIIDASMASGIVRSTAKIASHWVEFLKQVTI